MSFYSYVVLGITITVQTPILVKVRSQLSKKYNSHGWIYIIILHVHY